MISTENTQNAKTIGAQKVPQHFWIALEPPHPLWKKSKLKLHFLGGTSLSSVRASEANLNLKTRLFFDGLWGQLQILPLGPFFNTLYIWSILPSGRHSCVRAIYVGLALIPKESKKCHLSGVLCHMSNVTCYLSPVTNINSHSHRPSPC